MGRGDSATSFTNLDKEYFNLRLDSRAVLLEDRADEMITGLKIILKSGYIRLPVIANLFPPLYINAERQNATVSIFAPLVNR